MSKKDKHIKSEINNIKKKENDNEGIDTSKLKILGEDSNKEDIELAIPSVPEPPKQKEILTSPDLGPND